MLKSANYIQQANKIAGTGLAKEQMEDILHHLTHVPCVHEDGSPILNYEGNKLFVVTKWNRGPTNSLPIEKTTFTIVQGIEFLKKRKMVLRYFNEAQHSLKDKQTQIKSAVFNYKGDALQI